MMLNGLYCEFKWTTFRDNNIALRHSKLFVKLNYCDVLVAAMMSRFSKGTDGSGYSNVYFATASNQHHGVVYLLYMLYFKMPCVYFC